MNVIDDKVSMAFIGMTKHSRFAEEKEKEKVADIPVSRHDVITYNGKTATAWEFCKIVEIDFRTYKARMKRGLSIEEALYSGHLGYDRWKLEK